MLTIAVAVLLASPAAAPEAEAVRPDPATRACLAVVVKPSPNMGSRRRPWPARHLVRLDIETRLRGRSASSGVELHVLAPGGHLYQKISAPAPEAPGKKSRKRRPTARARLSVAGTQITQRGLYGVWSIVPYLEGSLVPCGPATTFQLGP